MSQKFYQKATVQASIVNAIPSLLVMIVGVVSFIYTYKISDKGFQQTALNFDKQFLKDSLNSIQQDSIEKFRSQVVSSQMRLAREQFKNDSIYQFRQLGIQENQLHILKVQKYENDTVNSSGLMVSKLTLRNYPLKMDFTKKDFDEKELVEYYGYEPDLVYPKNSDIVPNIAHYLAVFNKKDSDVIRGMPISAG